MSGDHNMYCAANQPTEKDKQAIRREWIGLTDEEINALDDEMRLDAYALCRAVEAKLKEKNT
jgi:hypothetical protein